MQFSSIRLPRLIGFLAGILSLIGFSLITHSNYLFFHTLAEIFTVIVASSTFLIAWNARKYIDNHYFLFLGIAFLFIGGIDLLHALAYQGIGVFQNNGANLSIQLWMTARFVQSISLLVAPYFIDKKINPYVCLLQYSGIFIVLLASIFFGDVFPDCYITGIGLTPFKKISEYLICIILFLAIGLTLKKRSSLDTKVLRLLIASILVTVASEVAFTFYTEVDDWVNQIGHLLKIVAFYLFYKAIIETGLLSPYNLLFRQLKQRENELSQANEELEIRITERTTEIIKSNEALQKANNELEARVAYRTRELLQINDQMQVQLTERQRIEKVLKNQAELLDLARNAILTRDLNNTITFWNYGAQEMYGFTKHEALGQPINRLLQTQYPQSLSEIEAMLFEQGRWEGELLQTKRDGTQIRVASQWTLKRDSEGQPLEILEINDDITVAKQTEAALIASQSRLAGILDIAEDAIISIDQTQNIILFNKGAERIFGYTADEVLGQPLSLLLPERFVSVHRQHVYRFAQSDHKARRMGQPRQIFGLRKDGTEFCTEASISQLELETGKIFTVILRDITERVKTETELRESKARLQAILDNAPAIIYLKDLSGQYILVNRYFETVFQRNQAETIGKTDQELFPEEFAWKMQANEQSLFQRGISAEFEEEIIQADQVHTYFSVKFFIKDEADIPYAICSISTDITERKQAEAAFQESDRIYRQMFEENRAIKLVVDSESGVIVDANSAASRFYGYELETLKKMHIDDLNVLASNRVLTYMTKTVLEQQGLFQFRHKLANGEIRDVEIHSSPIIRGGKKLLYSIVHDVTSRHQAEEALREREERFRKVFEEGPLGMAMVGLNYQILSVNPMLCKMLGYSAKELTGLPFADLTYPDDLKDDFQIFQQLFTGETPSYTIDKRYLKRNQEIIWCKLTASVVRDYQSQPLYGLVMIEDITIAKQAEVTLRCREQEFRALIENAPDIIARFNRQSHCQYINPEIERQLGTPPQAFMGKTLAEAGIDSELALKWEDCLQKVFATSQQDSIEFELMGLRGLAYYQARMVPEFSLDGNLEYVLTIVRNITDRKKAEIALQQANTQLNAWVRELEFRNREIDLLGKMNDILQACLTVEEAYTMLAQLAQPLFPDVSGSIYVIAPSKDLVELVATWSPDKQNGLFNGQTLFAPNDCWALRRGRLHFVTADEVGLQCKHVHRLGVADGEHKDEEALPFNSQSPIPAEMLCVPMMAQGQALGILYLSSSEPGRLNAGKQQLAVTVTEHISLALANLKLQEALKQQSIRDALTGLFNRRYLEESLEREINRGARLKQPLGIILLDVDHFKRFNDTYGHQAGDLVLKELGVFLQKNVRGSDIACRYGGEELIVILPEASLETTMKRAEFIREGVKHLDLHNRRQPLGGITVSLGVAIFPDHGNTGKTLIAAADGALYKAKREGRDRVVMAE